HWFVLSVWGARSSPGVGIGVLRCALSQRPSSLRTRARSGEATSVTPSSRRVILEDFFSSRWRLPARCRSNLPVPESFTRFAVPLWVLFFGMSVLVLPPGEAAMSSRWPSAAAEALLREPLLLRVGLRRRLDRCSIGFGPLWLVAVRGQHHCHVPAVLLGG